jgi:hypothetical protein
MDVDTSQFSKRATDCLLQAGWTSSTRVDTDAWRTQIERFGYSYFGAIDDFLHRFGGLRFHSRSDQFARVEYCLDPVLADDAHEGSREFEQLIGCAVAPVGETNPPSYIMMSEDRRFFLWQHRRWLAHGRSVAEFFDMAAFTAKTLTVVHSD